MTVGTYDINLAGEGLRIGIVQARFNQDVCHGLLASCLAELKHLGVEDEDILLVQSWLGNDVATSPADSKKTKTAN